MLGIRVLGQLEAEVDGNVIKPSESRRAWALLGWMALNPGLYPRSVVAATLWPDVLDSSALQSLRSALWSLRRALGSSAAAVTGDRERVGLDPDAVSIDLVQFGSLVTAGELERAEALWRGPLLQGFDEDWAVRARDEASARRGQVLAALCDQAAAAGDLACAVEWARRGTTLDPFSEEAARLLMRRLVESGDRPGAILVYERLSERLRRELSVAPSSETRELARELRQGSAGDRLLDQAPPVAVPQRRLIGLVGREAELVFLRQAWDAATTGCGGVCVVAGPAGIGKTRLLAELADVVRSTGGFVASAAVPELGVGAPLSAWAELAGELVRALGLPTDAPAWAGDLAPLVPAAAAWGPVGAERARSSPELERARLFEAICDLIVYAAGMRPLLLALEDMHSADRLSLELVGYVARRLRSLPVLVVISRREPSHNGDLDALTRGLRPRGLLATELSLGPLADGEIATLVRGVGSPPAERVREIVSAAEGVPLLAVEAARAVARGEPGLPAGLREVVRASFAGLGAATRTLAQVTAVAGGPLTHADARALLGEATAETFAATVAAGARAGLLTSGERHVDFRHALLRAAAYDEIAPPVRAALHGRIARRFVADGDDAQAAAAARHLLLAGHGDEAAPQLVRAAAHARSLTAATEAAAFLAEAAAIRPDDPAIALELAEAQLACGRRAESEASFKRACAVLDRSGDRLALARAHFRRGGWHYSLVCAPHEVGASFRRGLEILDEAGIDSRSERDPARAALAWAEAVGGDPERAAALIDEVEAAGEPVDELAAIELGRARATALARQERFAESFGPGVAAAEAAERGGWPELAYGCWLNAAGAAVCAGELERALGYVERCLHGLRGAGLAPLEIQALCARAWVLTRSGRLGDAQDAATTAAELARRIGDDGLLAAAENELGGVALARGDHTLASEHYSAALAGEGPFSRPITRLERAASLARLGRCEEAERELRDAALEPVRPGDWPDTLVARISHVQGLVAAALGDHALAVRRLGEAADGWRHRVGAIDAGERWSSALADLGRPVVGVVEPERELERVLDDLEGIVATTRTEA
jgi:DNA-binding SARP family transcriptional activator/tetratricopeptide (TPR) repeat protein